MPSRAAAVLALALAVMAGGAAAAAAAGDTVPARAAVVVDAGGSEGLGRHSEQLMGVTAYIGSDFDQPRAQQLVRELGIRSIGVQAVVTQFAPPNLSTAALKTWFALDDPETGSSPALRSSSSARPRSRTTTAVVKARGE